MRIRVSATVLLFGLLAAARADAQFNVPDPAPAENFAVELGAMFWSPTPEALIQTGALAQIGENEVDIIQEFGIDDKRFTEFRVVIKGGRKHKIRFSYVPIEYEEEAVLERTISFGGQTFPVNVPATAHLKWQQWRFGYEWDFVAADRGLLGLLVDLKYNRISAELAAEGFGTELTEATAPVPTIGVIARVYPHRVFSVTTEFSGFKMPGFIGDRISDSLGDDDDFEAKLFDLDIYGTVNFGRHVGVQGGYRSLTADYLIDEDSGDLKMKGTYFGGILRF
jgi:hypothetical protein